MSSDAAQAEERRKRHQHATFLEAVNLGDIDRVRKLLLEGVNVNHVEAETGLTALHIAAGRNAVAVLRCLVGTGRCDYGIKDAQGRTAATVAVTVGRNPAVGRYLFDLQHGAVRRVARRKGRSAEQTDSG